jgi:hypothetical protein
MPNPKTTEYIIGDHIEMYGYAVQPVQKRLLGRAGAPNMAM